MALMMTIVNSVADLPADMSVNWGNLVLFVLCAVAVISMQVYSLNLTAVLSERMIERVRARIAGLIRRSELDGIERIGTVQVYDTVARETTVISSSAGMIILFDDHAGRAGAGGALRRRAVAAGLRRDRRAARRLGLFLPFQPAPQPRRAGRRHVRRGALLRAAEPPALRLQGDQAAQRPRRSLEKVHLQPASQEAELKKVIAARRFDGGLTVSYAVFYTLLGSAVFILPQHLDRPARR